MLLRVKRNASHLAFKITRPIYPYTHTKLQFPQELPLKTVALFLDKQPNTEFKPITSFESMDSVHPIGVLYDTINQQSLQRIQLSNVFATAHRHKKSLFSPKIKSPLDFVRVHNGTIAYTNSIPVEPTVHRSFIHILNALFHTPYRSLIGNFYHPNCFQSYDSFLSFVGNLLKNDTATWQLMHLNQEEGLQFLINHCHTLTTSKPNSATSVQVPTVQPTNQYPPEFQTILQQEQQKLSQLEPHHSEYHVIQQFINTIKAIPFTTFKQHPVPLTQIEKALESHYGLEDVKTEILNQMASFQYNQSKPPILLFIGPPGTGKTSIAKSIAKALDRPFQSIPLGGIHPSELKGHRRTFVGSMPGVFIKALTTTKCMDPVLLLDEIDKITDNSATSILLEVLDPEQRFNDHYLGTPIDLSNCMFIATANTADTIPAPLLDRCTVINIHGYTIQEQMAMVQSHLLPRLKSKYRLDLQMSTPIIEQLVTNYNREVGVRQLWKELVKIGNMVIKENALTVNTAETSSEDPFKPPKFTLPPLIEKKEINNLVPYLKAPKYTTHVYEAPILGVVCGLAWTPHGGSIIYIESVMEEGTEGIKYTGHLKQVMKESVEIAYTVSKGLCNLKDKKIHLHVPDGGIPKDGPSAGITMATSLISMGTNKTIPTHIAMTGELTLSGKVLKIGGLREKVIAAKRHGKTHVIFPKDNMGDYMDIPEDVRRGIIAIPVEWYSEVYNACFNTLETLQLQ